jgi:hypothetical protein
MRIALLVATLLVTAVLGAAACTPTNPPPPPPAPAAPVVEEKPKEVPDVALTDADRACTTDADCGLISVDCCGCNAMGKQTAARKDRMDAIAARRQPICGTIACAQAISDDPSCAATKAGCKAGVCVAVEPPAPGASGVGVEPIK